MNLFPLLLAVFLIIPFFEIYLLITVGSLIGVIPTILLLIITALLGAYLVRSQGLATLQKMIVRLEQGQLPAEALLEGIFILLGGALLLTPGFLTDVAGLFCVWPVSRLYLVRYLVQYLQQRAVVSSSFSSVSTESKRGPTIIEGEYQRKND